MERIDQLRHRHRLVTATELYRRLTLPTRFRVLGYTLVPFTIGHARIIDRIQLGEIADGASALLCAKLCSMPHEEAERWLVSPWIDAKIQWMTWRRRSLLASQAQVEKAVRVLGEYLDEATRIPQWSSKGASGSELGTPFAQHLRATLLSHLNYDPRTVDSTPYLQAMWDYVSFMECEGRVAVDHGITDDDEAELIRQANEFAQRIGAVNG